MNIFCDITKNMSSTKEVNEYLKRLKNGEECLNEFFCAVSGHIKYIAYKYLVDKSFVGDVVWNTFCKVLDNIQSFDEQQNGMAWMYKIAQNEAYTINNRERKHVHVPLDEIRDEVACTVDKSEHLNFVIDLEKALSKLSERDRRIVEFRIFEGMTFEEIATTLGMYVGTVYKRFIASLKIIKKDIL